MKTTRNSRLTKPYAKISTKLPLGSFAWAPPALAASATEKTFIADAAPEAL
jgi:hypothetical protein